MNQRQWKAECAKRFAEKGHAAEIAAAGAESCADIEQLTMGGDPSVWATPITAADEEMARWNDAPQPAPLPEED